MQIVGKPQVSNRAFVWHPRQRLPKGDLLFCTLRQGPEMSQIFVILRWCQTCQKWFHHMLCLLRCVTRSFAAKPQPDIHITQLLEVWRFWNLWSKRNESISEVYEMKEVKKDVVLICFNMFYWSIDYFHSFHSFHSLLQVWKMYLRRLRSTVLQVREVMLIIMLKMSCKLRQCLGISTEFFMPVYGILFKDIERLCVLLHIAMLHMSHCYDFSMSMSADVRNRIRRTGTNLQERSSSPQWIHGRPIRVSFRRSHFQLVGCWYFRKTNCRPQHLQGALLSCRPTSFKHLPWFNPQSWINLSHSLHHKQFSSF